MFVILSQRNYLTAVEFFYAHIHISSKKNYVSEETKASFPLL